MDVDDFAQATLVAGAPRSGKTEFALRMLIAAMKRHGDASAVMTVSGRQVADALGDRVIHELSAVSQARPVTTLPAVAFRIMTAVRSRAGLALPKLLNGAEQDMVIRRMLTAHAEHGERGDECATCKLLRAYFAVADWSGMAVEDANDAFANQLRDMLARMNEIGAKPESEDALIIRMASQGEIDERRERLRVQWRLAFALRGEYRHAIEQAYPGQYRLDASQLMVDATSAVAQATEDDLPELLIVDDFQDATLAGFDFLDALHRRGVRLLLVGNPDESVQTFRGSYPEYLFEAAKTRMGARLERLEPDTVRPVDYRTLLAARVSLSIASVEQSDEALPDRPGKMPKIAGAWPLGRLPESDGLPDDGSVETALYRSAAEELDDVVWKIKTEHLRNRREWNDIALIAHDNATVRAFGERLRSDGVPVRYSSVTRPLKDEPFVQGLFALIELAALKERTITASSMGLRAAGEYIRSRVASIMNSPLVTIGGDRWHEGRPARITAVESAMDALGALASVLESDDEAGKTDDAAETRRRDHAEYALLPKLIDAWHDYKTAFRKARDSRDASLETTSDAAIAVDDTLVGQSPDDDDPAFGIGAMYILLLEGDTSGVLDAIAAVLGPDPQAKAFGNLWKMVDATIDNERGLASREPQYVLDCAWRACGKAEVWQRVALEHSAAGRAANDRLDAAMRLFSYASGGETEGVMAARTIGTFIEQVRSLAIEADSLARTAPIDQAVTLATPAGAAGRHWRIVFLPSLQQGQWPNLTPRNTLFGGEELADVMLHGELRDDIVTSSGRQDAQMATVLASEQKSFLVALTRADERLVLSSVFNDDNVPSDFLYGYVPERFDRERDADARTRAYAEVGRSDVFAGLDADPRGLVAAARSVLATAPEGSPQARDAAAALALLANRGVAAADPDNWPFTDAASSGIESEADSDRAESEASSDAADSGDAAAAVSRPAAAERPAPSARPASSERTSDARSSDVVTLSPSAVDNLWACPVCWMLENRFAGPRVGSAATNFGSIIHAVAQKATEAKLDLPRNHTAPSDEENIEAITQWMTAEYRRMRGDLNAIGDPAERFGALRRDKKAAVALRDIATYFVESNHADYPKKNNDKFSVGTLQSAEAEVQFNARFGFDDILAAYNAIDGIDPIDRRELMAIMGALVGGWPETGMGDDLTIRLTGRIDRLEHRLTADGKSQVRLIDYKTGQVPDKSLQFSDLQLVCYQLGLAFPETGRPHGGPDGSARNTRMPDITQSALFHVMHHSAPAPRGTQGDEAYHQQALFSNGSLNTGGFVRRAYVTSLGSVFQDGLDDAEKPQEVGGEHWLQFLGLRSTMAVWSLTMISRVFYAAAASRAVRITARPTAEHVGYCRCKDVCPACAGELNTVFERRTA